MTQATATAYVIPNAEAEARKYNKLALVFPLTVFAALAWGYAINGMNGALDMLVVGFLAGIALVGVIFMPLAAMQLRRQRVIWASHTYDWYRSTFPQHAHAKGRISCRHCGGEHIRTERLLKQTYMRVHTCGQCGETLYFSPEKR